MPAQRVDPPARPSLCQAGPCRHYHRLVVQVDAEDPSAVRLPIAPPPGTPFTSQTPQGAVYRAPASFHTQTHHYCYPGSGIEIELRALPIVGCSRWNPMDADDHFQEGLRRQLFEGTEEGKRYRAAVEAWEADRAAEASEADEAERLIAHATADAPAMACCQFCARQFDRAELDESGACPGCAVTRLRTFKVPLKPELARQAQQWTVGPDGVTPVRRDDDLEPDKEPSP